MIPSFGNQIWITPYGLMLVAALIACWLYARRRATVAEIDPSHVDLSVPLIFFIAGLGAALLTYFSPNDNALAGELFQARHRLRLFGLMLIGAPALLLYCRMADLPYRMMLDLFALPAVLWLVVLRGGCFLAGCCWGDLVEEPAGAIDDPALRAQVQTLPWLAGSWLATGVSFPAGSFAHQQHLSLGLIGLADASSLTVHPTQLYELVLLAVLLFLLQGYSRKRRAPGSVALATLGGYCVLRFSIEYLRADNPVVLGTHTFTQLICVVLIAGCAAAHAVHRRRSFAT